MEWRLLGVAAAALLVAWRARARLLARFTPPLRRIAARSRRAAPSHAAWDACARDLAACGVATLDVDFPTQALHAACFAAAAPALDLAAAAAPPLAISEHADSAHASGLHRVGALSQYNACREGFVISDGDEAFAREVGAEFAREMGRFFRSAAGLADAALRAVERRLLLPDGWFELNFGPIREHSQWHCKRYRPEAAPPEAASSDGRRVLLPVHSDPSLISVVVHDKPGKHAGAAGLEYLSGGEWREVAAHGHAVVTVFVGSILARITGGTFPAAKHRVAVAEPAAAIGPRVVATFFFRPALHAVLRPPPSPLLRAVPFKPMTFRAWCEKVAKKYEGHAAPSRAEGGGAADGEPRSKRSSTSLQQTQSKAADERAVGASAAASLPREAYEPIVTARGEELRLLGGPLQGQEKYLGGVLGDDGKIYAVPGHARRVLRIDPATGTVDHIGPSFEGHYKWLRAVKVEGAIYCIPCHHRSVLKIVPHTETVTLVGDCGAAEWKWHGGVVAADGAIYAMPQSAETVLRIDPKTDTLSFLGGPFPGRNKWYGGLLGGDGAIYGIPQNASGVLRIDPASLEVAVLGNLPLGGWKWHGGVVGSDGAIYSLPAHADTVLRIDPLTQQVSEIGGPLKTGKHRTDGKYKYLGGVLGNDGKIYGIPSDADHVLCIDPVTQDVRAVGASLEHEKVLQNKWQNGFVAADGSIYGIPLKSETVLCIRPREGQEPEVSTIPLPPAGLGGFNKWEGGVLGNDGCMYCMPLNHKAVLKVSPVSAAPDAAVHPPAELKASPPAAAVPTRSGGNAVLRSSAHRAAYSRSRKSAPSPRAPLGSLPEALRVQAQLRFDTREIDLRGAVAEMLSRAPAEVGMWPERAASRGASSGGEGRSIERRLDDFQVAAAALHSESCEEAQRLLTQLVAADRNLLQAYEKLLMDVVFPYLRERIVESSGLPGPYRFFYQFPPTLRLQPGPSTRYVRSHHDAEYGHQEGEINFWMPITDFSLNQTTLWVETARGRLSTWIPVQLMLLSAGLECDVFCPFELEYGSVGAFHGSVLRHYVPANPTEFVRMSLDFRVGIDGYFDPSWQLRGTKEDHSRREMILN